MSWKTFSSPAMPTSPAGLPGQMSRTCGFWATAGSVANKQMTHDDDNTSRFMIEVPWWRLRVFPESNGAADFEHSALNYLGPQAAAVDQALLDTRAGQLLQMPARFAQADAAQNDRADREGMAHEMIERRAARQQVAASLGRR